MKVPGKNASSGSISRLGPQFADRRPRIARPGLPNTPNPRNSNREWLRLETGVTRTKQTLPISSNREKEACFSVANLRPRWDSRAETPTAGVAGGRIRLVVSTCEWPSPTTAQLPDRLREDEKRRSTPLVFVSIKKSSVLCFVRLTEILIAPCFD
jgi:hypothetical protein